MLNIVTLKEAGYMCVSADFSTQWGGSSVPVDFASRCWELKGKAKEFKPILGYILQTELGVSQFLIV